MFVVIFLLFNEKKSLSKESIEAISPEEITKTDINDLELSSIDDLLPKETSIDDIPPAQAAKKKSIFLFKV